MRALRGPWLGGSFGKQLSEAVAKFERFYDSSMDVFRDLKCERNDLEVRSRGDSYQDNTDYIALFEILLSSFC